MYGGAETWRRHAEMCWVIRVANEQHTQANTVARLNNRNGHTDSLTAKPKPQPLFFSWWQNFRRNLFNNQLIQTRMTLLKIRVMYPLYYSWLSPAFPLCSFRFMCIHVYISVFCFVSIYINVNVLLGGIYQLRLKSSRLRSHVVKRLCRNQTLADPMYLRGVDGESLICRVTWLTQSYVWHDSLYYVTWRNHTGHASFNFPVPPWCLTWTPHSYVSSSYVWNYSVMCVVKCDMTRFHGSVKWVTWLNHTYDLTYISVWHDSFLCAMCLISSMPHSFATRLMKAPSVHHVTWLITYRVHHVTWWLIMMTHNDDS